MQSFTAKPYAGHAMKVSLGSSEENRGFTCLAMLTYGPDICVAYMVLETFRVPGTCYHYQFYRMNPVYV